MGRVVPAWYAVSAGSWSGELGPWRVSFLGVDGSGNCAVGVVADRDPDVAVTMDVP